MLHKQSIFFSKITNGLPFVLRMKNRNFEKIVTLSFRAHVERHFYLVLLLKVF